MLMRVSVSLFACSLALCMVVTIMPPSGTAGMGLSHGFTYVFSRPYHIIGLMAVAVAMALMHRNGWYVTPILYVGTFLSGALWAQLWHAESIVIWAAAGVLLVTMIYLATFIVSYVMLAVILISSSYAFHAGHVSLHDVPELASHAYFAFGQAADGDAEHDRQRTNRR